MPSGAMHKRRLVATLIGLNAVSLLSQLAQFGMLYPLLTLWLGHHGMPPLQIGFIGSAVWAGMLVGNLCTPGLLARVAPRRVVGGAGLLTAAVALLMPQIPASQMGGWAAAAVALGVCIGLRWVAVEGWLYAVIPAAGRGRLVGLHETFIQLAQSLGPAVLAWVGLATAMGFHMAAGISALALMPLAWANTPMPQLAAGDNRTHPLQVLRGIGQRVRRAPGLHMGLVAGLLDGVLFSMLPAYLLGRGLSAVQAAGLMAVFGVGGLVSQWPLGWWSDRHGLRSATHLAALMGLGGAALLWQGSSGATVPAALLLGLVAAAGLTLAIIATTAQAHDDARPMSVAVAEVSLAFTLGSLIGPVLAGAVLQYAAGAGYVLLAALCCIALPWTVRRPGLRPPS